MKKGLIILVVSVLLIACKDNNNVERTMTLGGSEIHSFAADKKMVASRQNQVNQQKKMPNETNISRKLIKNGHIVFETENLVRTKNNIILLVNNYKGYIASDSQNEYNNRINYRLNIRIPVQSFDSIVSKISKEVITLDSKEISISDVTAEFLDIESRLKNKKELENKYLQILKKANNVKDILDVERELGKLREDIEATEGRLKYLQNQVSFSTLNITFYKKTSLDSNFFTQIKEAFSNGFEKGKAFFVWFISTWPFLILILIVWVILRKKRNIKNSKL